MNTALKTPLSKSPEVTVQLGEKDSNSNTNTELRWAPVAQLHFQQPRQENRKVNISVSERGHRKANPAHLCSEVLLSTRNSIVQRNHCSTASSSHRAPRSSGPAQPPAAMPALPASAAESYWSHQMISFNWERAERKPNQNSWQQETESSSIPNSAKGEQQLCFP